MPKHAISPTRCENYPEWYQQVVKAADLAEMSVVRGCMVIKPWGYALWEHIQKNLDAQIKATGHDNIYCPLFIPLEHLQKEAGHVDGFATECAVVTHHRLVADAEGKLQPAGQLEQPLVVRPTSETIIGELFANWVQSYRDLPVKINQWANVVRWEMRTRMFLRTSEFLWQEGHTAHATADEALTHTKRMLQVYVDLAQNYLAMPVIAGEKTESERFPGADHTYCIEAMMQDKKALQAGTSHFLGQNFAKAFNIQFQDQAAQLQTAWTTSWGVSTRLIGGLIMTHSDDDGLVLPPRIAPQQVVILPITRSGQDAQPILAACEALAQALREQHYAGAPVRAHVDNRPMRGGDKTWSWVKKGVPIRVEIGQRELEQAQLSFSLRHQPYGTRQQSTIADFVDNIVEQLTDIQASLLASAAQRLKENAHWLTEASAVTALFDAPQKGGFAFVPWCDAPDVEVDLKAKHAVTVRCVISVSEAAEFIGNQADLACPWTQKPCEKIAVLAKSY